MAFLLFVTNPNFKQKKCNKKVWHILVASIIIYVDCCRWVFKWNYFYFPQKIHSYTLMYHVVIISAIVFQKYLHNISHTQKWFKHMIYVVIFIDRLFAYTFMNLRKQTIKRIWTGKKYLEAKTFLLCVSMTFLLFIHN